MVPRHEVAALARVLPLSLIREVLVEAGKQGQRQRKLPSELVVWLVVGMGLFRGLSVQNVLQQVVDGLGGLCSWGPAELPHKTSIAQARDRVGWEVLRTIFQRLAAHLAGVHAGATTWRGLLVYVLDGTCFMVPDTPENEASFGRPGSTRGGKSGYPQLRVVLLVAAWTHVVVDAVVGPYTCNEGRLAEHLVPRLKAGCLILLDRAFYTFVWPARLLARGDHFAVRAKRGRCAMTARRRRRLGTGDWLAELRRPAHLRGSGLPEVLEVRLITCARKGYRPITVMTSLLDSNLYPAREVALLYVDRWEAELSYRELKTYMASEQVTFRSKKTNRVLQEVYGLLVAYNCVRALMCEAAEEAGVRPIDLSFTDCLERLRRVLSRTNSPDEAHAQLVAAFALCRNPPRRVGRRCDRAVKIKMSCWPRKRPGLRSARTRAQNAARKQAARTRALNAARRRAYAASSA